MEHVKEDGATVILLFLCLITLKFFGFSFKFSRFEMNIDEYDDEDNEENWKEDLYKKI